MFLDDNLYVTHLLDLIKMIRKVSEYDQDIPQSHTVDQPTTPLGRAREHQQPQHIMKTIKVKQPSLASPSR